MQTTSTATSRADALAFALAPLTDARRPMRRSAIDQQLAAVGQLPITDAEIEAARLVGRQHEEC